MLHKRLFDILASLFGLIVLSPLLLFVAIWVKLDSKGPVFYRGVRLGKDGKPFRIFKFRSMVANADKIGVAATADNDFRITRSGKFIRKCKLDEISQLINVLLGDMSIVGPRPEDFQWAQPRMEKIRNTLSVRPGITDWASIWNSDEGAILLGSPDPNGMYERILWQYKLELQQYYIKNRSFFSDIKIILYTLLRIVQKNTIPKELQKYPTFHDLRGEVVRILYEEHGITCPDTKNYIKSISHDTLLKNKNVA
ncbi:MAG: sugar transferase, partial [Planctomycetaceae bacterium]|jgi:lipopolysaccharide/colanic/teichoic acid biosynthesis glycosyltransferase|nr:sugar transferase [Planctomycetaceae bacterium]